MKEKDAAGFFGAPVRLASDSKVKAEQYRVQVRQDRRTTGSQVQVLNKDGAAESSKTAQRILTLLHEQLK